MTDPPSLPLPVDGDDLELWDPDGETSLVELVHRLLDKGVVLRGDLVISIAGIDLVYAELRLLLSSVATLRARLERTS